MVVPPPNAPVAWNVSKLLNGTKEDSGFNPVKIPRSTFCACVTAGNVDTLASRIAGSRMICCNNVDEIELLAVLHVGGS